MLKRHFAGVTWRCLSNPDAGTIETHALVRGSNEGLLGNREVALYYILYTIYYTYTI